MKTISILLCVLALSACQTSGPRASVALDAEARKTLLDPVKALAGTWELVDKDGQRSTTEFQVSSGGSVVREIMFAGTPHEMTNLYHLDGNALVVTHYCAMGNQPRLRATALEDGKLAFRTQSVSDLKATDAMYMGELTLVLVDHDHMEERWRSIANGAPQPDHDAHFAFTRRK